jgi:hypothetical protein
MFIYYGTRHCGPVDRIEGLGEVRTRFFHLYFVPIIPLGSTFVTKELDDGVQGIPVGLSIKSVLVAWSRTAFVLSLLGLVAFGGIAVIDALIATEGLVEAVQKTGDPTKLSNSTLLNTAKSFGGLGASLCGALFSGTAFWAIGRIFRDARGARKAELMAQLGVAPGLDDAPV